MHCLEENQVTMQDLRPRRCISQTRTKPDPRNLKDRFGPVPFSQALISFVQVIARPEALAMHCLEESQVIACGVATGGTSEPRKTFTVWLRRETPTPFSANEVVLALPPSTLPQTRPRLPNRPRLSSAQTEPVVKQLRNRA